VRGFGRILVLTLAFGILYSGPVAACVCADTIMPAMPCCPDAPQDSGVANVGLPVAFVSACDPAPADLLPSGSLELPAPSAISTVAPPPWQTHPPSAAVAPKLPEPRSDPPIYLVTLRLRN